MSALYIHIPFCKQKCHYCNFFSTVSVKNKSEIVEAIITEIEQKKNYLKSNILETIYFGGGTPSILSDIEISSIFNKIHNTFLVSNECEITFEANPDDISQEKLLLFKSIGINRLSIGIQSFNDKILEKLNRIHSSKDAIKSIELSKEYGFNNLNIDLIYGIPDLSLNIWKQELEIFNSYNIPHLSAYSLTIELKTALDILIKKKKYPQLKEKESMEHYNYLIDFSNDNNYLQYEISNFSLKGNESKHNCNYWKNEPYLGIGPSANSFNLVSRQWNSYSIKNYIRDIKLGKSYEAKEDLSINDRFNEYVMLGLRTRWGISKSIIRESFGDFYVQHLNSFINAESNRNNFIKDNDSIKLTKKAMNFADRIASDIFII